MREADDDSPWRPDADVEFEVSGAPSFAPIPEEPRSAAAPPTADDDNAQDDAPLAETRGATREQHDIDDEPRSGRWKLAVGGAAILLAAVVVVVRFGDGSVADIDTATADADLPGDDAPVVAEVLPAPSPLRTERPAISTAPVCEGPRLPDSLDDQWFVALPDAVAVVGALAAGDDGVAALVAGADDDLRLEFFDAADGTQRWAVPAADLAGGVPLIDVVGDAVLTRSGLTDGAGSTLRAFDIGTGARTWEQVIEPNTEIAVDRSGGIVAISSVGDELDPGLVTVVDPSTGEVLAGGTGAYVAYREGRVISRAGGKILASGGPAGDDELIGVVDPTGSPFVVVGDTVVVAVPKRPGELFVSGRAAGGAGAVELAEVEIGRGVVEIGVITALLPVSDSSFLASSNGAVFGVQLEGGRFRAQWSVDGVPLGLLPTERGATVLVSREGGAAQLLVDAATGRVLVSSPTTFGGIDQDDLFRNGVVVSGGTGTEGWRRATDLDGDELWELPGRGDLAIGAGTVYEVSSQTGTGTLPSRTLVGIRALGDGDDSQVCETVPSGDAAPEAGDVVLGAGDVPLSTGTDRCLPDRLPAMDEVRWSAESTASSGAFTGALTVGGGLAFATTYAPTAAGDAGVTELIAFDLDDGGEAWRTSFVDVRGGAMTVRSADEGVVLVSFRRPGGDDAGEPSTTVAVGLSTRNGEELWRQTFPGPILVVGLDDTGRFLVDDGGGVESGNPRVSVHDVATGAAVSRQPGRLMEASPDGPLITDDDGLVIDGERVLTPQRLEFVASTTNGLVVQYDGGQLLGYVFDDGDSTGSGPLRLTGSGGIEPPASVDRISRLTGTSILIEADGAVYGANVSLGTIELRWRRIGQLVDSAPSDRGRTLVLQNGAGELFVVDSSTGRDVVEIPDVNARLAGLFADAVTVARFDEVTNARSIVAIDLDGRARWSVGGATSLAAADRVAVAIGPSSTPGSVSLVAIGEVVDDPARCATVLREWVVT